ncbi:MAG: hypothetical protein KAF91_26010 [Nostoc sp. TH1S01]|nr:hypothetical protein [Nostoc sp. TH1S01]
MKSIASVTIAVLSSTAIGGVFLSDSQVAHQPDIVIAQQSPSPSPSPTTPTPSPTTPTPSPTRTPQR